MASLKGEVGHTPGPWFAGPVQPEEDTGAPGGVSVGPFDLAEKWGGRPDYTPSVFNDHYEDQIALVSGCNHNAEANARLISAAPDLLEALKLAEDVLSRAPFSSQMWPPNGMHPNTGIEIIRAAIAKASAIKEPDQ